MLSRQFFSRQKPPKPYFRNILQESLDGDLEFYFHKISADLLNVPVALPSPLPPVSFPGKVQASPNPPANARGPCEEHACFHAVPCVPGPSLPLLCLQVSIPQRAQPRDTGPLCHQAVPALAGVKSPVLLASCWPSGMPPVPPIHPSSPSPLSCLSLSFPLLPLLMPILETHCVTAVPTSGVGRLAPLECHEFHELNFCFTC